MDLKIWLLFVATEAALCLSPGPAVLYVTSHGLSRGFRSSVSANLGIVTGNIAYFAASAIGVGSLILASHELFLVVKWCGVGYLVWLGIRMLLRTSTVVSVEPARAHTISKVYRGGILVQLSNPKNLVFFLAILPPFIDPSGNVLVQMLILGVTSQTIEIITLLMYGAVASRVGRLIRGSRLAVWVDRVAGSILVSIGVGLALIRRADA